MQKEVFRIIDANFNRSREGLRVCEDIARFVFNSPGLTEELKSVRHSISNIIKAFPATISKLFAARDTEGDVGRGVSFKSEMKRKDSTDIFYANMERVKESLRVLEEFSKLIDKKLSNRLAVLRYRAYDIEKRSIRRMV